MNNSRIAIILGLLILKFSGCKTYSEDFSNTKITPNHRLEAKVEQSFTDGLRLPNSGFKFNLEVQNFGSQYFLYAGSGAKVNFNKDLAGMYIGPNIGLTYYFFNRQHNIFAEFDLNFMVVNFNKPNQIFSTDYGINLGYSHRWAKSGYSIYVRYENNYVIANKYYMIGVSTFINFRW
jgi:hypothetical protein